MCNSTMKALVSVACAVAAAWMVSATSVARAEDRDSSEQGAQTHESTQELENVVLFGFSHAFRLIRDRGAVDATELRRSENVYGFLFGYERILHRHVALSIIKPFYFNRERIDSPLEIVVTGLFRKNRWEPFLGAGIVSILSRIEEEGSATAAETVEFSVGILFVTGFKYFFKPNWAIELELGYEFIPRNANFEHGFADSYQGAYLF